MAPWYWPLVGMQPRLRIRRRRERSEPVCEPREPAPHSRRCRHPVAVPMDHLAGGEVCNLRRHMECLLDTECEMRDARFQYDLPGNRHSEAPV